jgi:hypothetical protein
LKELKTHQGLQLPNLIDLPSASGNKDDGARCTVLLQRTLDGKTMNYR